jgi:hypothetical protein
VDHLLRGHDPLLMAFFNKLLTMSTARSGKLCNEAKGL